MNLVQSKAFFRSQVSFWSLTTSLISMDKLHSEMVINSAYHIRRHISLFTLNDLSWLASSSDSKNVALTE